MMRANQSKAINKSLYDFGYNDGMNGFDKSDTIMMLYGNSEERSSYTQGLVDGECDRFVITKPQSSLTRNRLAKQMTGNVLAMLVFVLGANLFISPDQRQIFLNGSLSGIGVSGLITLLILACESRRQSGKEVA